MSIDRLQNMIRKIKNPLSVVFAADKTLIPPCVLEAQPNVWKAYAVYAKSLIETIKGMVPSVRFRFSSFALLGPEGLELLQELLTFAQSQGLYVLLDVPELLSAGEADLAAEALMGEESQWKFDALVISCYIGSDAIKPFAERMKKKDKALFVVLRTGNKSAPELQDLLTGSRLVYSAAADMVKRLGENSTGKGGYSRIAGMGPATSADALRSLRSKYPALFIMVDGSDLSGANAKNCSMAFDKLGHGAIVCAEHSVTAAWKEDASLEPALAAVQAVERIKKNITRYVTIL